jgi:cytochrome c5
MQARAGMADLSDAEIKRAIEYMFNAGTGKEVASTAGPAPTPAPAPAATTVAAAASAGKPDGKKVYDTACMACHATGAAGAPKYGDKAAWAPRVQTGMDALYTSSLKGKGAMPAKGGTSLPDADVKAAVDYLVAAAK